ncbi:MAG: glutamate synthase [Armatimonadetes bacterium]|nr:glutamate synthase [Armatimonadota bacterium]
MSEVARILESRKASGDPGEIPERTEAGEGGCGVVGLACSEPVKGKHIIRPSLQMHNRGNGKGGGIAACGLVPEQLGVSARILEEDYLIQIAYLDPSSRVDVEKEYIGPNLDIHHSVPVPCLSDPGEAGLTVAPPLVVRYFARAKGKKLKEFAETAGLQDLPPERLEDEFIYRSSYKLNRACYASLGEKRAFVLCHGKNLLVFKVVGYAEEAARYYLLDDMCAHIWIAHQRYPTKGRVWHPAGAHPFIGLHEALVHNGDFANYHAICEYLAQRGIYPLFLTDTEVSALLFDLLARTYSYPTEEVIEALAPTTERDFELLPEERRERYRRIQAVHMHGSPDGPWFFIIARNDPFERKMQLIGITDTSMLRPQVFALQQGLVSIGLIASEKQAIDAALESLAAEDSRFLRVADRYWNARGGSYTDGGAFLFTLARSPHPELVCTDKFGNHVPIPEGEVCHNPGPLVRAPKLELIAERAPLDAFLEIAGNLVSWDFGEFKGFLQELLQWSKDQPPNLGAALGLLTLFLDRRYPTGNKRRSVLLSLILSSLEELLDAVPGDGDLYSRVAARELSALRSPTSSESTLIVDALDSPPEGSDGLNHFLVSAYRAGWRKIVCYRMRGQRFVGCGLGPGSEGLRLDVYGSSGDYLASGLDGAEIHAHGSAQDQIGQIMRSGTLVVHGDVGQTFFYGAKGGSAYILGNGAGRPMINAVGRPRVVINGTCLDYLAESFMAGNPLEGGGFVVLNGIVLDENGAIQPLPTPYPGGNLFSLASGGAIYARDPHGALEESQLNGGQFATLTKKDWELIFPYLQENERLFGIPVDKLLTERGKVLHPREIYRKIEAVPLAVLGVTTQGE